jgi:hypothetical protein
MAVAPPLASQSDLAALVEDLDSSSDSPRAGVLLRMASALVRQAAGRTFVVEASDPPVLIADVPEVAWSITLAAAQRAWENPQGTSSTTISIDDFSQTDRLSDAAVAGVELTDLGLLKPTTAGGVGGLGVLSTTRCEPGEFPLDTLWLETTAGGTDYPAFSIDDSILYS